MKFSLPVQIILNCLSEKIPADTPGLLEDLKEQDWNDIITETDRQSITPLFYYILKKEGFDSFLPEYIDKKLRNIYMNASARNFQNFYQIESFVKKLQAADIPVILLKGAHLADEVYENITLRYFCDVDILIKQKDLERAFFLFKKNGYNATEEILIESIKDYKKHLPALIKAKSPTVEIHWTLTHVFHPFNIDVDGLWQRAEKISVQKTTGLGLCPEDLLLHLSIHSVYDHYFEFGLKSLYDISMVISHYGDEIDWEQLLKRAKLWKAERCLSLSLIMTMELLKIDLPEQVKEKLYLINLKRSFRDDVVNNILKTVKRSEQHISPHLTLAFGTKGFFRKINIVFNRIFPSKKIIASKYPVKEQSIKIYLYYPVRWKDLIMEFGSISLKMLFGNKTALKQVSRRTDLREWLEK